MQQLAVLVAVVEHRLLAQAGQQRRVRREACVEVVVVVAGDLQQRCTERTHRPRTRQRVAGGECDVLRLADPRRPLDADPATAVGDHPAAHQSERRGELGRVLGFQPEHRAVEQRRLVVAVERLGERDVVEPGDPGSGGVRIQQAEVTEPAVRVACVGAAEEHRCPVRRGDRGQVGFVRPVAARQHGCEQPLGPPGGAWRVRALHRDGAHRGAFPAVRGVDQDARFTLPPQLHRLGPVFSTVDEAEAGECVGHPRTCRLVCLDLGERMAVQRGRIRQRHLTEPLLQRQQGPHRVDRRALRVRLPEGRR